MENLHVLSVESKRRITVTEAKEVISFSEKEIRLKLKDGSVLCVFGDGLRITSFDDKNGLFGAVGSFSGSRYKQSAGNFVKKVFG